MIEFPKADPVGSAAEMLLFAQIVLLLWLPIVVIIFAAVPPKRAVAYSYVFGWLFLPIISFNLPGFPDYSKMSATVVSVLICTVMFHPQQLTSFRFSRLDLPVVVFCVSPFFTSISNDLGAYDGLSSILEQTVFWGLPYFVGRIYLNDLDGFRELARAIVIGGVIYIPFCLVENRLSMSFFANYVYGLARWDGLRYGAYRPTVFLETGLEVGMWMVVASLVCTQLWLSGSIKLLNGISTGFLSLALIAITILCRSTGAIILMFWGMGAMWMIRRYQKSWLLWSLILIGPLYCGLRSSNLWSGRELVDFSRNTFGQERGDSIEFRLNMEDPLINKALTRPIFGWGRFDRAQILNKEGNKTSVVDGYWILVLGIYGLVGLTSIIVMMLLPIIMTMRRYPRATWFHPQVAPATILALFLVLMMIDFLSNAMLNPIYAIIMGGLIGLSPNRELNKFLSTAAELMSQGQWEQASVAFRESISISSGNDDQKNRSIQAQALDGLGQSLLAIGHLDEAEMSFQNAVDLRAKIVEQSPSDDRLRDLAIAQESLSRVLAETNRKAEAIQVRENALQIWDQLVARHPRSSDFQAHLADALNDLAWLLVIDSNPQLRNPARALELVETAFQIVPDSVSYANTLGVARYRTGDWAGAIEALEGSAAAEPGGVGTAFDHYFLAMAWSHLQDNDRAQEWFEQGMAWASKYRPDHPILNQFREEAATLLNTNHNPSHPELT